MSLKNCYVALGGDLDSALGRLRSERLVQKYVLRFLSDDSYSQLCAAMAVRDSQAAFRAAHTIKGVCANLGFDRLRDSSDALCEKLRNGWSDDAPSLFAAVTADYDRTVEAIRAFEQEQKQ